MKKAKLNRENIRKAILFLERRLEHAKLQDNKEWVEEFENALAMLKGLAACD